MAKPPERETASHSVPERETPVRRGSSHPLRWERRSLEDPRQLLERARVVGLAEPEEGLARRRRARGASAGPSASQSAPSSSWERAKTACSRTFPSRSASMRPVIHSPAPGAPLCASQKSAWPRTSGSRSSRGALHPLDRRGGRRRRALREREERVLAQLGVGSEARTRWRAGLPPRPAVCAAQKSACSRDAAGGGAVEGAPLEDRPAPGPRWKPIAAIAPWPTSSSRASATVRSSSARLAPGSAVLEPASRRPAP